MQLHAIKDFCGSGKRLSRDQTGCIKAIKKQSVVRDAGFIITPHLYITSDVNLNSVRNAKAFLQSASVDGQEI